jgi:hypothetical protein
MLWDPEGAITDFLTVARLAGTELRNSAITIQKLPAPHIPKQLPSEKVGVYAFSKGSNVLKIGKAGPNSGPR